jgi:two-component system OmpR family response regulator
MEQEPTILLVEDDTNFGGVLKDYLELHEFNVILAKDGVQGIMAFKNHEPTVCILDVMMPHKDGFTLAREIRDIDKEVPIVFLTAKSMKQDILNGYQIGADDYLTKPFDSEVLLYKIKALLARSQSMSEAEEPTITQIGTYRFDMEMRRLHGGEKEIKLSPKENALLKLLLKNKNQLVSRSEALKKIWKDDNYFTGRSMDVYVAKLRKHFKDDENIAIVNVHSEGFRLVDRN